MKDKILDEGFQNINNQHREEIEHLNFEKKKYEKKIQWGRNCLIFLVLFTILRSLFFWKYHFNEGTEDMTEAIQETAMMLAFYIGGFALSFSNPKQTFFMILIGFIILQFLFLFQGHSLSISNIFLDIIIILIFFQAIKGGIVIEQIDNRIKALNKR